MLKQVITRRFAVLTLAILGMSALASCTTPQANQPAASGTTAGATCAPEFAQLDFGIISTESQDNQKPKWEPFIQAMSEQLGRPVKASYATDYAAVIEAMGAKKVQIAWYGGKSYIEAADRSNAEAFARVINEDGSRGYFSHLITNVQNPIVSKIDLTKGDGDQYVVKNSKDLTFAFNDPESTSGFLVPGYYVFARNGVNPDGAFKNLTFAGSHEATAQAVINNQVDVATNNSEQMEIIKAADPEAYKKIQVIWTSPEIPSDPIAYRKDLPDCLKQQIKDFFLSYKDASILGALDWQGFEPAQDTDWNTIRELKIGKEIMDIQNDKKMGEADKAQKVAELNKQLEALK
ncbi:MAG: phosphonate ABC transporter substrate-binding protein [Oculatellaceae cyanobacterium Prado106]|jgi:phosphonate transport system substrate-binding protein|nr:phosphonate ABC transporter substrate-binding protein [Oculatellaceae cyanobacterium Prado106]